MDKGYEGEYIFSEEEIESILEAERRRRGRDLSVDTVERVREILIERYSSDEIVRFNATELVEILITEIKVLFRVRYRLSVGRN
jgi:hypothetical protein